MAVLTHPWLMVGDISKGEESWIICQFDLLAVNKSERHESTEGLFWWYWQNWGVMGHSTAVPIGLGEIQGESKVPWLNALGRHCPYE